MYFNGGTNHNSYGVVIIIVSPQGSHILIFTKLDFGESSVELIYESKLDLNYITVRLGKSDPTRITWTERIEILPKLTPEIIDLKFTQIENDPYRTKLNANSFYLNQFSFQENLFWLKISWSELKTAQPKTEPESNHIYLKITQPEANPIWTHTEWPVFQV